MGLLIRDVWGVYREIDVGELEGDQISEDRLPRCR